MIGQVRDFLLTAAIIILGILCFFCMARSIIGPKIADRIVAVNMIGTMTIMIIAILAVKMQEGFLVDVAIIYALVSFLAVVVIVKVYMGVYREREEKERHAPPDSKAEISQISQNTTTQLENIPKTNDTDNINNTSNINNIYNIDNVNNTNNIDNTDNINDINKIKSPANKTPQLKSRRRKNRRRK